MANGEEDLQEKNKGKVSVTAKKAVKKYDAWKVTQGREDAEMLQEKNLGWSAEKENRSAYDDED